MTTTIEKYLLPVTVTQDATLAMPLGSQIICVTNTTKDSTALITLYVRQETGEDIETRHFIICGTEGEAPKHALYVGTAFFNGIPRHVFDGATK